MSAEKKKHDVFLSFRGEDIRKTFMPQLNHALIKESIKTYVDYTHLKKGEKLKTALNKAIQESHITLVVLSANFATSKWCLDELVEILKCRRVEGHEVLPVFYETDPSDIRKQEGSYKPPFARYEGEVIHKPDLSDIVRDWKDALAESADLCGWDSRIYRDDSELTEDIVKDVRKKLFLKNLNQPKDVVQIDKKNTDFESLLKKYQRIGIWGMNGIGKTTIAKQMFIKHSARYDSACLLENVREESEKYGTAHVRNKLLCELLKQPVMASDVVRQRLNRKKIFVVLDDVDDEEQLEDFCRDLGDLRQESRLIITTKDMQVVNGRVDAMYKVTNWKLEESRKLFCLHAFGQNFPKVGFEHILDRVVAYAGGIPLALKTLGSYFKSKDPKFWESKLYYFENKDVSFDKIQDVLTVTYDGLTMREKEMFLDIAFFFKDMNEDVVIKILDACGFKATRGMHTLKEKCLITISFDNKIQMHDLWQEMAFNIVRYRNGSPIRDRSRLMDIVEVRDILKGSHDKVEGIILDLSQKVDLHVCNDTFYRMTKLRVLRLYVPVGKKRMASVSLPDDIMSFSDKLRYLEWNGYRLKSLPQPFFAKFLVEIRLPHSNVVHLWHGVQELVNLEGIDLSESKHLIKLPDLSRAPKLKSLDLSGCESLCGLQHSAFFNSTLVTLLLDRCTKLQSLMSEKYLNSLKTLNVDGCISLKEFSLSSSSIDKLDLSNTGIEILHPSIGGMNKLELLNLEGLMLQNLPGEISRMCSLTHLRLSNCSIVTKSKLEAMFDDDGLKSLKVLYLKNCCNLFELPSNISSLASLYKLRLDGSNVKMLPISIKDLLELEILSLDNCRELCCLAELAPRIKEFHADNCTSLMTVSTLKSFSASMSGGKKYISFKNGSKMELDGLSLNRIKEDAILMMKNAANNNIEVRKSEDRHGYNYNEAEVCFPGSIVPRQFEYRTTDHSSSITIDIDHSNLLGFIFSIVVSSSHEMKGGDNTDGAHIQCQCYLPDRSQVGTTSVLHSKAISNLNMDHIFVSYDPYHFDSIFYSSKRKITFEFCIISYTHREKLDGLFSIKQCGICPIYCSEDNGIKLNEIGDEKNQDLNEKSHRSYDSLISTQVIDNTREKENRDDDGNSTEINISDIFHESSRKSQEETETSSQEQEQLEKGDYTGGSEDAKLSFKKAMMLKSKKTEEIPTETGSELHLPVVSVVKESTPIVDLDKPKGEDDGSGEDPFAELESILLGSPESSPKATFSTSDIAVREALHNLECLLENSLESIIGDTELQRQLHMSLECINLTSHDKVSPNVTRFVDSMTSSIDNLFKDFALAKKVVQDHNSHLQHKEKLMQRMSDAKKRKELVKKEKSQCEDEARCLEEETKMLDEKIRILVEQKKSVELKKGKMKERMERCEGEEKELVDEAKNMITESKELISVIKNSTSSYKAALQKQQKLNDKWEGFKTTFADN